MYQAKFRLRKDPFAMTPDPSALFNTTAHRDALAGLTYAVLHHKGFVLLTGESGTGKTTVLSRMMRFIPADRAVFSLILNPTLNPIEFLEAALLDFGVGTVPSSKVHRLLLLQRLLIDAQAEGKSCVLIVDEAHKLSADVLEEIRLLTNFENSERKLMQIILSGQVELCELLNREDLRQLKQRIALRFVLQPLAQSEVGAYLAFRWKKAGGESQAPFSQEAIDTVAAVSAGIPRIVNSVCDNALILAYGMGDPLVTAMHVRQAAVELDLLRENRPAGKLSSDVASQAPANSATRVPALGLPQPVSSLSELHSIRLKTLERYLPPEPKPSRLSRAMCKLKLLNLERTTS
jgi:general secretion pathway protein A